MSPQVGARANLRSSLIRLALVGVVLLVGAGAVLVSPTLASTATFPAALDAPECGPGAEEETDIDGRVPSADYSSGRYRQGYQCNAMQVGHQGRTGGFKVQRYVDRQGHECAYYDSTLLLPKDTLMQAVEGLGVVVLDMSDPARPRKTAELTTPAMMSPHESLVLNHKRGILGAELGNPTTNASILDLYDVRTDCRSPKLLSSTPTAGLGHESGFAPDGNTFYITATGGQLFQAVDVSEPKRPEVLFTQRGVNYHGVRVSDDGRRLYVANLGNSSTGAFTSADAGLRILDVSQIQDRKPEPEAPVLSSLSWPEHSIAQAAEPFTRNGRDYLLEFDEFANYSPEFGISQADASVGAARIIDIEDDRHPKVISDIRLAVHQPEARADEEQQGDPGANNPVQGYAAHYCSMPTRTNPHLVACSMILSGLRVFDISDVENPRQVAYFNQPVNIGENPLVPNNGGAHAMSQPAWDPADDSVWYSDGNSGFYNVRLTNGVEDLLAPAQETTPPSSSPPPSTPPSTAPGGSGGSGDSGGSGGNGPGGGQSGSPDDAPTAEAGTGAASASPESGQANGAARQPADTSTPGASWLPDAGGPAMWLLGLGALLTLLGALVWRRSRRS